MNDRSGVLLLGAGLLALLAFRQTAQAARESTTAAYGYGDIAGGGYVAPGGGPGATGGGSGGVGGVAGVVSTATGLLGVGASVIKTISGAVSGLVGAPAAGAAAPVATQALTIAQTAPEVAGALGLGSDLAGALIPGIGAGAAVAGGAAPGAAAPLVISQVVGEAALPGQVSLAAVGGAAAAAETAPVYLSSLIGAPAAAAVGAAIVAAPVIMGWQLGVFESSDWSDDIPKARTWYTRAQAELAARYGGDVQAARSAWHRSITGQLPGHVRDWTVENAYRFLLYAYWFDRNITGGLGGALGEKTGIAWSPADIPILELDVDAWWRGEHPELDRAPEAPDTGR